MRTFTNIYERNEQRTTNERQTDRTKSMFGQQNPFLDRKIIFFFEKEIHFGTEKFHFCQKSHLFVEKSIFGPENNNFHKKIMLGKNPFVCRIIHFLTERSIFEQKSIS